MLPPSIKSPYLALLYNQDLFKVKLGFLTVEFGYKMVTVFAEQFSESDTQRLETTKKS